MTLTARRVGLDEPAVIEEQLAFQALYGTSRHSTLEDVERVASAGQLTAWTALEARGPGGDLVASGEALLAHVFGPGSVQMNAITADGRADALRALVAQIEVWPPAAQATTVTGHLTDPDDAACATWIAAGFAQVGDRTRVRRAITAADTYLDIRLPAGVGIVALADAPELEPAADAVWREVHRDIPTELPFAPDPTLTIRRDIGVGADEEFPPGLLLAITEPDRRVVGIAYVDTGDTRQSGGHRMTGVIASHRGHGIARALKRASIRWAARAGATDLGASNDSTNPAMRHINDEHGYEPVQRIVLMRCVL